MTIDALDDRPTEMLLFEQDPATLVLLESCLATQGVTIRRLRTAQEARAAINRHKFHGAILNWDAAETRLILETIRNSPSNRTIPVAMLTESVSTIEVAQACKSGASFFLTKPLVRPHLDRLLAEKMIAMREERRAYQRVPWNVPVQCSLQGNNVYGQSINLSASGILVELSAPQTPHQGSKITVGFPFSQWEERVALPGLISRVCPGSDDTARTIGVRFTSVSADRRETLKQAVAEKLDETV